MREPSVRQSTTSRNVPIERNRCGDAARAKGNGASSYSNDFKLCGCLPWLSATAGYTMCP